MKVRHLVILFFISVFIFTDNSSKAQVIAVGDDSTKVLYRNEWSFGLMAHSLGYGIVYRQGKHLTGFKKLMYELDFLLMKDPKEYRILNQSDPNAKSYFFGKLNYLFILRPGIGIQKVVNSKPYWGGVEIRYFYFGGLSLGITKPVYLYVYDPMSFEYGPVAQRYDPNNPNQNSNTIVGRAPFTYGLNKLGFHPGIYGKFGFNFEFGSDETKIRCLEVGSVLDLYPYAVPLMALNTNNHYFLTVYLTYSFGRRLNK